MDGLSEADRDLMIRTVMAEAGNQPLSGQAGVAHVIQNRVNDGGYGDGVRGVITKPWQFEPWMTRRKEMMGYDPDSEALDIVVMAFKDNSEWNYTADIKFTSDENEVWEWKALSEPYRAEATKTTGKKK